jgi:hypothetical protein
MKPLKMQFKVQTETAGDILVDEERLRFRNGCPVQIKSKHDETTLDGKILAVCDIPDGCDRKRDEKAFWYSIQVLNYETKSCTDNMLTILHEVDYTNVSFRHGAFDDEQRCTEGNAIVQSATYAATQIMNVDPPILSLLGSENDDRQAPRDSPSNLILKSEFACVGGSNVHNVNVDHTLLDSGIGKRHDAKLEPGEVMEDVLKNASHEACAKSRKRKLEVSENTSIVTKGTCVEVRKIESTVVRPGASLHCNQNDIAQLTDGKARSVAKFFKVVHNTSYQANLFHKFKCATLHKNNMDKMLISPWGTNILVCLAYHVNSKCHDGCESEVDHRPLSPVNAQRLLKWCEIQMNPKFVCHSSHLFDKLNVANLNRKKRKKSFPSSPYMNVPMCLAYHIYGKCSISSCKSTIDHRALSPENAQLLLKWCESESPTCYAMQLNDLSCMTACENSSYQADMFGKFRNLKKDKKTIPTSPWDMNVPMCLAYHIHGFCISNCNSVVDHCALSPKNAQRLLKWCESESLTYYACSNSSYQADVFGKFKVSKLKKRKKTIPTSPWDNRIPMCLAYHINGRCMSSCKSVLDHRALSLVDMKCLFDWCEKSVKAV